MNVRRRTPSVTRRLRQGLARGVTLIELMVVIVIIGVFVALAGPAMAGIVRERWVGSAARELVGMFQQARFRAAATGSAHAIIYSSATQTFSLYFANDAGNNPVSSCMTPTWNNVASDDHLLTTMSITDPTSHYAENGVSMSAIGATAITQWCFTPAGRFYVRNGYSLTWNPMVTVAATSSGNGNGFAFTSSLSHSSGAVYNVIVGTNGLPTLQVQ